MKRIFNFSTLIIITIAFLVLGIMVFSNSYYRLREALQDLGLTIGKAFCYVFGIKNNIVININSYSKILTWEGYLPDSLENIKLYLMQYFALLFNGSNLIDFLHNSRHVILFLIEFIVLFITVIVILKNSISEKYKTPNNNYNVDSKELLIYKKIYKKVIKPIKDYIKDYIDYLKKKKTVLMLWLVIWLFNLNISTIIIEVMAYYIYFFLSLDIGGLFIQFAKLLIDLQIILRHVPLFLYIIVGIIVFNYFRKNMALHRLRHYEAKNCGLVKELPITSLSCGSMGKKKTTLITDMALSQEVMFRQEAFNRLQKADIKFPQFPWIMFEKEIQICMKYNKIYNLASIKKWVDIKQRRFEKGNNNQLYGYDYVTYGLYYNNGLYKEYLFDVLKTYAQLYFIYIIESSLIISNYSIREDNFLIDEGNFPIWNLDFFSNKEDVSHHSHILDFDILRLGKKVIENNKKNGSFEFGIIVITEIGKERGNNLELKEVKKLNEETNQKNDAFNAWLKMCRHSATIDNFPFVKVFTDEQRPESWGADARDLCDIITIVSSSEQHIALPFYTIEEMFIEGLYKWFIDFYYDVRFYRGDNTLLVHLLKRIVSFLYGRGAKISNLYGYSTLQIEKQRGTQDGKVENKKYYLSNQKIYNKRFNTDCFSDYFNDMSIRARLGIIDYIEYETEKASVQELKMQNSYFINSLYKGDNNLH